MLHSPCSSSPSHLWPHWPCIEVISAMLPHRDAWWKCMTYIVRFNNEDQGSHGTLCFYLIGLIYIFILKYRIPFMSSSCPTIARAYLSLILLLFLRKKNIQIFSLETLIFIPHYSEWDVLSDFWKKMMNQSQHLQHNRRTLLSCYVKHALWP